jgi:disulfide bond formation protein DsbB
MPERDDKNYALLIAWIIALAAMLSTLYMSEILRMPVCPLCWYQRVGIYPLTVILGIALFRNDRKIYIYALPLAGIAACFALYQYLIQLLPGFNPIHFCTAAILEESCSQVGWQLFGFITLPLLSFISCLTIMGLLLYDGLRH